jgi:hypothetical protein
MKSLGLFKDLDSTEICLFIVLVPLDVGDGCVREQLTYAYPKRIVMPMVYAFWTAREEVRKRGLKY